MGSVMIKKSILIIMMGLVGTGKTTLAQALAERLGAVVISSDVTRKRLAGIPINEHFLGGFEKGIYSPEFTDRTYEAMLKEADSALVGGNSVILDASFVDKEWRLWAMSLAETVGADFMAAECVLAKKIVKERLSNRKDTASDGRWEIYQEQKKVFEPVVEIPPEEHVTIDASKPVEENAKQILELLSKGE